MNAVERVKAICKERKIPISKLEADCGFANGYIGQLRKGTFPNDRLLKISEYLNVSVDYILTDGTVIEYEQKGKEHAELLRMYEMLTSDEKEQILNTMKLFLKNK